MGGTVYGAVVIKDSHSVSDKKLHVQGTLS